MGRGAATRDAAYDPDRPCTPAPQSAAAPVQLASAGDCDPDAAYDPSRPCQQALASGSLMPPATAQPVAIVTSSALYQPAAQPFPPPLRNRPAPPPVAPVAAWAAPPQPAPGGAWAIQVGAFANPGLARAVAEGARAEAPDQLRTAAVALPPTTPFGGSVLYRARLVHLSASAASGACLHLNQRQLPCVVVQPTGS
ncbi:MAG: SPOR domain-containing protein [Acetobacteraceae bacterium]